MRFDTKTDFTKRLHLPMAGERDLRSLSPKSTLIPPVLQNWFQREYKILIAKSFPLDLGENGCDLSSHSPIIAPILLSGRILSRAHMKAVQALPGVLSGGTGERIFPKHISAFFALDRFIRRG